MDINRIDIREIDTARLLAALYNHAQPQGMGLSSLQARDMTVEEAKELLREQNYFDYIKGRIMKVQLREGQEYLDARLYMRDNGEHKLQEALFAAI